MQTVKLSFLLILIMCIILMMYLACDPEDDCECKDNNENNNTDTDDDNNDDNNDDDNDDDTFNEGDWKDEATNLFWQIESYPKKRNWFDALKYCEGLSQKGQHDWRLPSISELRSLIRGCGKTETEGECGVTDECLSPGEDCRNDSCWGCMANQGPTEGCYWPPELEGNCFQYWSSSYATDVPDAKWVVRFEKASVQTNNSFDGQWDTFPENNVRCVRTK